RGRAGHRARAPSGGAPGPAGPRPEHAGAGARLDHLLELLACQQPERTGGEDLRGFEWYYWQRLCHTDLPTLAGHAGSVRGVAFSPDGKHLASASNDKTIKIWDAQAGQEERALSVHTRPVYGLAFTGAGK